MKSWYYYETPDEAYVQMDEKNPSVSLIDLKKSLGKKWRAGGVFRYEEWRLVGNKFKCFVLKEIRDE